MTLPDLFIKALTRPWMPLPLSFAAGILASFAMAPTSLWPLLFIGLSCFYILYAQGLKAWGATLLGFFFALGYFMSGLWWIGNALLVDGNEFAWVWPISVIGLPTLLALFTGVACGVAFIIAPPRSVRGFIAFIACVALAEWVRGHIFTGFPWNLYGYAWGRDHVLPIAQVASIGGAYGLSLLTLFWATLAGFLYIGKISRRQTITLLAIALASFTACAAYGVIRLKNNPTVFNTDVQLQIVQPNIKQDMKWDPGELVNNFEKHLLLSRAPDDAPAAKTTLILWPETAIGPALSGNETARDKIVEALKTHQGHVYLLSGLLDREEKEDGTPLYFNSLGVFTPDGDMRNVYSKTHLVPLGEFIPFQQYIPIKPVVEFSGFQRGNGPSNIALESAPPFSPLICYEIIFSGNVVDRGTKTPSEWIAAITNDGWYGISAGPFQHFQHAVFRSIEEGLPVARSANTGISGLTDAYGRTLYRTKIYEDAVVFTPLPLKSQIATPFSYYGNGLYLLFVSVMIIGCCIRVAFPSRH